MGKVYPVRLSDSMLDNMDTIRREHGMEDKAISGPIEVALLEWAAEIPEDADAVNALIESCMRKDVMDKDPKSILVYLKEDTANAFTSLNVWLEQLYDQKQIDLKQAKTRKKASSRDREETAFNQRWTVRLALERSANRIREQQKV